MLTESYAMYDGGGLGLRFPHPENFDFGVGWIEKEQVEGYARRKGWPVGEAEPWRGPDLNYEA
jgi:5-methyltetrahydrofolate--homocysteine methyltransferase